MTPAATKLRVMTVARLGDGLRKRVQSRAGIVTANAVSKRSTRGRSTNRTTRAAMS